MIRRALQTGRSFDAASTAMGMKIPMWPRMGTARGFAAVPVVLVVQLVHLFCVLVLRCRLCRAVAVVLQRMRVQSMMREQHDEGVCRQLYRNGVSAYTR